MAIDRSKIYNILKYKPVKYEIVVKKIPHKG